MIVIDLSWWRDSLGFKILLVSQLMLLATVTWGIPLEDTLSSDNGPWVMRVYSVGVDEATQLQQQFDVWSVDSNDRYAVVAIQDLEARQRLERLGFTALVDPVSTARYRASPPTTLGGNGIPGFACYRTVEETQATTVQMVANFPDIAELIDVGDSWERTEDLLDGFDLQVLRLTNRDIAGDKPTLFVMSAIHAREYTTAETMTRFAERLVNGYNQDSDITWLLDHHEIHLLLQSNPDGRKQAETGLFWRKNTNQNYCGPTSEDRGADLNRNFPFEWGGAAGTAECDTTYQGPSPESEPEVQAVVDYVRSIFPDQRGDQLNDAAPSDATGVFIDVHSFSQLVLWPWGFAGNAGQAPNQTALSTMGRRLAFFNNYRPQQILGLTAASGSTADFAYGELGVAAYAFELGTSFFESCVSFENNIVEQNIDALMYAANVSRTPYQTPSGPDVTEVSIASNTVLPGQPLTVQLEADGTRFSTLTDPTSPLETARTISRIDLFLNSLPWQDPATASAIADDGSFGGITERANAVLNTDGLTAGRFPLFVTAEGGDGQSGAIASNFVFILDPATAGRLFGRVTFDGTTTPAAGVSIQAGPHQAVTNASGDYSLNLPAGSFDINVKSDDFEGVLASVVINTSEQEALDLSIPGRCSFFSDAVENGNIGWTPDAPWAITTEQSNSPTNSWHDSPGGDYQLNQNITLVSPVIDLSGANETRLMFNHICDTESGFDFGIVEISSDGNNWQEVYRCDDQESWQAQQVDINGLDDVATAQIRFRLVTDDVVTDEGWYLDDIEVTAISDSCEFPGEETLFRTGFEG